MEQRISSRTGCGVGRAILARILKLKLTNFYIRLVLTENSQVLILSKLPGESAVRDVVQVLEPFEVGDGDTTSVEVEIGNDEALVLDEDIVSFGSDGAVGTFGDDLGFDAARVVGGDDLFFGTGAEDVALDLDETAFLGFVPSSGAGEASDAAGLQLVLVQSVDVDAVLVEEAAVPFDNTDAFSALDIKIS